MSALYRMAAWPYPFLILGATPKAHLGEEWPLLFHLLHTVSHKSLHGFGAVLVELTKIGGGITSTHHEDDLG